ncbi:MAG: DUF1775 domain-containing protein [Actinobacteria bacterium]|nr:DUF1775 domain-containing protein [Actinomycetota bacterium]
MVVATAAMGDVIVAPDRATVDVPLELTLRVPTEGTVATTGVDVRFPPEFSVYSFAAPPPGWAMRPKLARNGTFSDVSYRGGPSGRDRYVEFRFLANPTTIGTARWATLQRFVDGSTKRWSGPPETPGATIPETAPGAPGPSAGVRVLAAGGVVAVGAKESSGDGVWLGIVAIAISAAAAALAGFVWSSRPARLPDDRPGE